MAEVQPGRCSMQHEAAGFTGWGFGAYPEIEYKPPKTFKFGSVIRSDLSL